MTTLITGLGYIGARLAEDLLAAGESVVALENFFCTSRSELGGLLRRPGLKLIRGSINRPDTLQRALAAGPVRALVHLAAQPSAHPEAASARYTELTNLVGARLTLEAARGAGVEMVVLGSSFRVYGDDLANVVTEQQPYGRVGDLAHLSKIYLEKLAEMMAATRGPRCVAVRLGITYGLGPVMKTDPRFMTVPNRFAQLAAREEPLTVHAGATRPAGFIHVEDAGAALRTVLGADWSVPYWAVNAVAECLTVREVAECVRAAARERGLRGRILGPALRSHPEVVVRSSLSSAGFRPRRRLAESVGEVIDYFRPAPG
jgi:nucleoside-diphosphate-sugar epimerase